jgi:hypothetical protein
MVAVLFDPVSSNDMVHNLVAMALYMHVVQPVAVVDEDQVMEIAEVAMLFESGS